MVAMTSRPALLEEMDNHLWWFCHATRSHGKVMLSNAK
jgi:hypothetical protein